MWGGSDEAESIKTIQHAVDIGINLIDTAPAVESSSLLPRTVSEGSSLCPRIAIEGSSLSQLSKRIIVNKDYCQSFIQSKERPCQTKASRKFLSKP